MPRLSTKIVRQLIQKARNGTGSTERGKALEDLIVHMIECVPGIESSTRNVVDYAQAGEIDILFANRKYDEGFWFFPTFFLVECKNWTEPVGSQELRVFVDRLKERGCSLGILVASNGITGDPQDLSSAHNHISRALEDGRDILVVTLDELDTISARKDLTDLLLKKMQNLKAFRSSV
jgi:hypothetical protein